MVGTAFGAWNDSGYLTPTGSPHGGFTTTTKYCAVCHAVHHAQGLGGEVLLRSTVSNACSYCHIDNASYGYIVIYNGVDANYTADTAYNHSSAGGARCVDCHQVHAAAVKMTGQAYLNQKILKVAAAGYVGTFQSAPLAGDANYVAEAKWCSGCHPYYNTGYNGTTHRMNTAALNYGNPAASAGTTQVAFTASDTCRQCHASGNVAQTPVPPATITSANNFPHLTTGIRFLTTAVTANGAGSVDATTSNQDGVCLRCHRDGGVNGVGLSY